MKRKNPFSGAGLHAPVSRLAIAALAGVATPLAYGEVLVSLDATALPTGPLNSWSNTGSVGGTFSPVAGAIPAVTELDTVKGVTLNGSTHFYTGPAAPESVTGNGSRTVEAWIYNPAAADEETIFSWGRRGGPDATNLSFNHGLNATFGAVGQWGAGPDIGWNGAVVTGRWTYVAYSYDGASQTGTVYSNGVEANSEVFPAGLNTHAVSDGGLPLPFRVGSQNEANGTATAGLRGSMTIARIRVHDVALDAAAIADKYAQELDEFGIGDPDGDGLPTYYERRYPTFLNPNDPTDAGRDQDTDGRTNLQEFQANTLPDNPDTDGDGLNDGAEATQGTNPLRQDSDVDGVLDGAEAGVGGNPTIADTDSDGYLDGQEVLYGSQVNGAGSVPTITQPLVVLDATALPLGNSRTWANTGTLPGNFTAPVNVPVTSVAGVKGFTFNGTTQFFTGPGAAPWLAGNGARTIEAWIYNPVAADEETIFSWGRRGGPNGSNTSFNHGVNATWGAVGIWGAPDIGWGDPSNVAQGQWTHVAYTWDPANLTTLLYKDGAAVNSEILAGPLVTHAVDTSGNLLPFRVAAQNEPSGAATGGLRGSMTIARIRVHDRTLDETAIATQFTAEANEFGLVDTDGDGLPTWYERLFPGILDPADPSDASKDFDSDSATNAEEFAAGTPPGVPDADGDGVLDGVELKRTVAGFPAPTNPLVSDTDQDGLNDGAENTAGTDPLIADTDSDGVLDGQEVARGSNPSSGSSVPAVGSVATLIDLKAEGLSAGSLDAWPNTGKMGASFKASGPVTVGSVAGVQGVTFDGTSVMDGPVVPLFLTGDAPRTVDAWIYNPEAADEETIFSFGRRGGGPDGSNNSFNHGLNGTFGALGQWGGAWDVGWNGKVVTGQWTHVAYTYDPATTTVTMFSDGQPANTKVLPGPLSTHSNDNLPNGGRPLVFRVAGQTDAAGGATAGLRGSLSIGRLRVYDSNLSPAAIQSLYAAEAPAYAPPAEAPEITGFELTNGDLTLRWTIPTSGSYNLLGSADLGAWEPVATGLTGGEFKIEAVAGKADRYFRLVRP